MSSVFTNAPLVRTPADATSANMAALAEALNSRIRSGIGNGAYRVAMLHFNLSRQIRLPNADGNFHAQGEALETFAHVPRDSGYIWPNVAAGDPEGANLASPLAQLLYGNGLDSGAPGWLGNESDRLNIVPVSIGGVLPTTPEEIWTLGKLQRGVVTADLTGQNAPALAAAQSFMRCVFPPYSPMGKGYGGYQPTPELGSPEECVSGDLDLGPNYRYKLTALRADAVRTGTGGSMGTDPDSGFPQVTYHGRCPDVDGAVAGIARMPFFYYVLTYSGTGYALDSYSTRDWIEGPYTGAPSLQREDGGMIERVLWAYAANFRGTPAQRTPDTFDIRPLAFAFQKMSTMQWPLAPNVGHVDGTSLVPDYPAFTTAALSGPGVGLPARWNVAAGAIGSPHTLATIHSQPAIVAGWFVKGTTLAGSATVQLRNQDGRVLSQVVLVPDGTGAAAQLIWFRYDLDPAPTGVSVYLDSGASFTAVDGQITAETTELYPYRPDWWDLALAIRLSTASA